MSAERKTEWTPDTYLAYERAAEERHEYHDGLVVLQAGGSRPHARIAINVSSALHAQLRSSTCNAFGSDMRIGLPRRRNYFYADVVVACDDTYEDEQIDTLTNPTVIIEVLSPSTEAYDRGRKFHLYATIPSLRDYLLVAQDTLQVDHFRRHDGDLWLFASYTARDDVVVLASIDCTLPLSVVYEKITIDASV